jgi:hypothetical protein
LTSFRNIESNVLAFPPESLDGESMAESARVVIGEAT